MAGNHLENLIAEWYEYRGFFVRKNVPAEKRDQGGYATELDVVAFDPRSGHVVHLEPSLDADSWDKRELRFQRKFEIGRRLIPTLLAGLPMSGQIEQIAVLVFASTVNHPTLGGARVMHASELIKDILNDLRGKRLASTAVPEHWPLLRTLQYVAEYSDTVTSTLAGLTNRSG